MFAQGTSRQRFTVTGIVQGVGFRPHVYALATGLGLVGWVENTGAGVTIEVEGNDGALELFAERLVREAPPLADIETVEDTRLPARGDRGFVILGSDRAAAATTLVAPDVATCSDCLEELADPADRRFGYAFTNCTNCGPRYSIVTDIPYDRPNTTMASFELCEDCRAEYRDPTDRRFHAQPVCCPACGPTLSAEIDTVATALRDGEVVAVKGLGGYHLTALASSEEAVARLRRMKHREDKPFALMVPDVVTARTLCRVSEDEEALLRSGARPIVVMARRRQARVAAAVAPGGRELGLMLPYTPLHHLLLDTIGAPIVCTSANISDEPIAYRDDDATARLGPVADSFLTHDRAIRIRVDDSVARVVAGEPYLIRRSRGYAPAPIRVPWNIERPVLACGADLKNTIALGRGHHVFLSQHIGDLGNPVTHASFVETIGHLCRLFEIEPAVVAHDMHPQYRSTAFGVDQVDLEQIAVQHHHAHIAACLADAGRSGPVIGVAFDGMGYGDDGTIWGGEFLEADLGSYIRWGWLAPVRMPGGDAATREPWRMALSYLDVLGEAESADLQIPVAREEQWRQVLQVARSAAAGPVTSSAGRLFDAVASLVGVRDRVNYEGQAAIELEQLADRAADGAYRATICSVDDHHVLHGEELVAAVLDDVRRATPRPTIAMRFHRGLADATVAMCGAIRDRTGLSTVALSGGVFLNTILLHAVSEGLRATGFTVLRHRQVPCNDGGISLGQVAVAAATGAMGQDRIRATTSL